MKVIDILLIEDNPGDVRLIKESFKGSKMPVRLAVIGDGEEALRFLHRQGDHAKAVRPHLILLDLNLPRQSGRDLLAQIKADEQLRCTPVIVLSSSEAEQDIRDCYDLHANCYLCKPVNLDQFLKVIRGLEEFWLALAKLPPSHS